MVLYFSSAIVEKVGLTSISRGWQSLYLYLSAWVKE
jgi:hypothetical protein